MIRSEPRCLQSLNVARTSQRCTRLHGCCTGVSRTSAWSGSSTGIGILLLDEDRKSIILISLGVGKIWPDRVLSDSSVRDAYRAGGRPQRLLISGRQNGRPIAIIVCVTHDQSNFRAGLSRYIGTSSLVIGTTDIVSGPWLAQPHRTMREMRSSTRSDADALPEGADSDGTADTGLVFNDRASPQTTLELARQAWRIGSEDVQLPIEPLAREQALSERVYTSSCKCVAAAGEARLHSANRPAFESTQRLSNAGGGTLVPTRDYWEWISER